jgi:hypothetical protein
LHNTQHQKNEIRIKLSGFFVNGTMKRALLYSTGGTVPTSGPLKEAWRNCCSGLVLYGNDADIADVGELA